MVVARLVADVLRKRLRRLLPAAGPALLRTPRPAGATAADAQTRPHLHPLSHTHLISGVIAVFIGRLCIMLKIKTSLLMNFKKSFNVLGHGAL